MGHAILRELVHDGQGRLSIKDIRYLLVRPETLVSFQKAVEAELGGRAGELMAEGGRAGGALSWHRYREAFGLDARGIVEFMVRMGGEIGWGEFALDRLDLDGGELVMTVRRSPFAEAYGPAASPICHLITGVIAGLAEGVFEGPVDAGETACVAAGAPACRFRARARAARGG